MSESTQGEPVALFLYTSSTHGFSLASSQPPRHSPGLHIAHPQILVLTAPSFDRGYNFVFGRLVLMGYVLQ